MVVTITNGYITRNELREQLGDDDNTTRYDDIINAVSRAIDEHCKQFFWDAGSALARTFRADNPYHLDVMPFSTTTGLIVKTDDGNSGTYGSTWTVTTDYVVESSGYTRTGRSVPMYRINGVGSRSFPTSGLRERVQVTARWGWAAVPPEVKEACMIKAARLARRKDAPEGEAGGYGVMGRVTFSPREDFDVLGLLGSDPIMRPNNLYVL